MSTRNNGSVLGHAVEYLNANFAVIPLLADGTKRPAVKYKAYRDGDEVITRQDVVDWFAGKERGIGLLTGPASGNLVAIDIDEPSIVEPFKEKLPEELLLRLAEILTPRVDGGRHLVFRSALAIEGKEVFARRWVDGKRKALVETTNYIVAPGSDPKTHKTGKSYELVRGSLLDLATLTAQETELIFEIARSFNEIQKGPAKRDSGEGVSIFGCWSAIDDFNARAEWTEVLSGSGAELVHEDDGVIFWARPGKDGEGHSATSGFATSKTGREQFKCFSSNWPPFEPDQSYSKFNTLLLLEHGEYSSEAYKATIQTIEEQGFHSQPVTDQKVIEELLKQSDIVRWCPELKAFMAYSGDVWAEDPDGAIAAREIRRTVKLLAEHRASEQLSAMAVKVQGSAKIGQLLSELKRQEQVKVSDFDAKPELLNLANGVYNTSTKEFRDRRCGDRLTKLCGTPYEPGATCPKFEAFLDQIMLGRSDLVCWLRRFIGLAFGGYGPQAQVMAVCWGVGKNGKSTLFEILRQVLSPYVAEVGASLLTNKNPKEHALYALQGARLALMEEFEADSSLNVVTTKQLVGATTIACTPKYKNPLSFPASHALFVASNHCPNVDATDPAIWRRMKFIPFDYRVPDGETQADLADKLAREEGPGILQWVLEGLNQYLWLGGLGPDPASMQDFADRLQEDVGDVGAFLDELSVPEEGVSKGEVWAQYADYLLRTGNGIALPRVHLWAEMIKRGWVYKKMPVRRWFKVPNRHPKGT